MDEILNFLKNRVIPKDDGEEFLSVAKNKIPVPLTANNFHTVDSQTKDIFFVDGGNGIILETPAVALALIRISCVKYSGHQRIGTDSKSFYILTYVENDTIRIKCPEYSDFEGLIFDIDELNSGSDVATPSRVIPIIRRFAELDFASKIDTFSSEFIVLDGSLDCRYQHEDIFISKLLRKTNVAALSKTTMFTTNKNIPITRRLNQLSNSQIESKRIISPWYYYPVISSVGVQDSEIYFLKLHERSKYVFRFDISNGCNDINGLISGLSYNSSDAVFIGYPYGLIFADQSARITEDEIRVLRTKVFSKLEISDSDILSDDMSSVNAHGILDKIRF